MSWKESCCKAGVILLQDYAVLLDYLGLVLATMLKKGYHQIWEANLQPFGPMFQQFISNLGPNSKPKMLKVGPQFFRP